MSWGGSPPGGPTTIILFVVEPPPLLPPPQSLKSGNPHANQTTKKATICKVRASLEAEVDNGDPLHTKRIQQIQIQHLTFLTQSLHLSFFDFSFIWKEWS